jgi:hypothetical protein
MRDITPVGQSKVRFDRLGFSESDCHRCVFEAMQVQDTEGGSILAPSRYAGMDSLTLR